MPRNVPRFNVFGRGTPNFIVPHLMVVATIFVKVCQRIDRPPSLLFDVSSFVILNCPIKDSFYVFILCFNGKRVRIRRKLHRHPQCLHELHTSELFWKDYLLSDSFFSFKALIFSITSALVLGLQ